MFYIKIFILKYHWYFWILAACIGVAFIIRLCAFAGYIEDGAEQFLKSGNIIQVTNSDSIEYYAIAQKSIYSDNYYFVKVSSFKDTSWIARYVANANTREVIGVECYYTYDNISMINSKDLIKLSFNYDSCYSVLTKSFIHNKN